MKNTTCIINFIWEMLLISEIILLSADVKLVSQLVWIAQAHWIVNMAEVISEWEVNQSLGLRGYLSGNIKNYLNVFLISYFDYKEFLCQIRNDSRSVKSASDSAVCRVLIMHWTTRSLVLEWLSSTLCRATTDSLSAWQGLIVTKIKTTCDH